MTPIEHVDHIVVPSTGTYAYTLPMYVVPGSLIDYGVGHSVYQFTQGVPDRNVGIGYDGNRLITVYPEENPGEYDGNITVICYVYDPSSVIYGFALDKSKRDLAVYLVYGEAEITLPASGTARASIQLPVPSGYTIVALEEVDAGDRLAVISSFSVRRAVNTVDIDVRNIGNESYTASVSCCALCVRSELVQTRYM